MKLKISILFLILAVGLAYATLNYDKLFMKKDTVGAEESLKGFSKREVFDHFENEELFNYLGEVAHINKALLQSADVINIHLWASWCAPCVNEVPELIDFAHRITKKNEKNLKVIFIAVSLDEELSDLNKFLKSFPEFNSEPFIRIWDKKKTLSKLLDADRLPMTVILNKNLPEPRVVRGVVEWKNIQF
jgi:thiol-disulfide isomerase/thioredoxin